MTTGLFPRDPVHRRSILVLEPHAIERCGYEQGATAALIDPEAYILPFPVPPADADAPALQTLLRSGLVRPGGLLIQNPHDLDAYVDATEATERFALAKYLHFSVVCQRLGATEVKITEIDLHTRTGKVSLGAKGKALGASGKFSAKHDSLERLRAQMALCDTFDGGEPDVTAAEDYLQRTGLWGDPVLKTLVEACRPGSNRMRSRTLELSLSREAKHNLTVAAGLVSKIKTVVDVSADYKQALDDEREYSLKVVVRF